MSRFLIVLLSLLTCLPLLAQDADGQKKFVGTWEARFKGKVICTIRVKAGQPISGETSACSINVDENGDIREPDSDPPGEPSPMLGPQVHGDTLTFEEKEDDDMLKFELKIVSDGQAELKILDTPMAIKPIHFARK